MDIIRYGDLAEVPWKNGGGITRNIAAANSGERTAWRLSRADVAGDGAFSLFPGLVRILTVVTPGGMTLTHPGGTLQADAWDPVRFDGGWEVMAHLREGPLTDLNLMFDPTLCAGSVVTRRGPCTLAVVPPVPGYAALHVLAGQPRLDDQSLQVGDTAFPAAAASLRLGGGDAVLDIALRYLDQSNAITCVMAAR